MKLLAVGGDAKTPKGEKKGYLTGILYLAPNRMSGHQVCPFATKGCIATCLNTAGRGVYSQVQQARLRKTQYFFEHREKFMRDLWNDIGALVYRAYHRGMHPAVRLNGTSDLPWEIIEHNNLDRDHLITSDVQFYDYTKNHKRYAAFLGRRFPPNYHLTFSRSESNMSDVKYFLSKGGTVAVVFSTKKGRRLPRSYIDFPVIDGDLNDLRFKDPESVVVGLRAKGKARHDTSGFVVQV